ncbi:TetR/AcrR family transcriptional regulator [Acetobacter cibinongensis]|uniref:TetR/AcrR family transcriptional regulator n=1 Tax=Acetobacter cibinongensis TaxID=146475 RepID=UPI000A36B30C|nr:TetR-like C-terminal domain-containing protein [Acetobacter cibinongensis]
MQDAPQPGQYHHGNLRTTLLQTARKLLETEGPSGLKLRAITRAAGVSAMAAAPHFGNLQGLLTALATQGFEELSRNMEQVQPRTLNAVGIAYILFALQNPGLFTLMFRSDAIDGTQPGFRQVAQRAFSILEKKATAAGDTSTDAAASALQAARWAQVHGLAVLALDGLLDPFVEREPGQTLEKFVVQVMARLAL